MNLYNYDISIITCIIILVYLFYQDDYIDCYGDPSVTGKIGTDIEECKCGWLVVQALDRVTPQQREMLKVKFYNNLISCD